MRIDLELKGRGSLMSEKGEGEGYRHYPSPQCGLGFPQCPKQYLIDTTDFGFNQGSFSFEPFAMSFFFGKGEPVGEGTEWKMLAPRCL